MSIDKERHWKKGEKHENKNLGDCGNGFNACNR